MPLDAQIGQLLEGLPPSWARVTRFRFQFHTQSSDPSAAAAVPAAAPPNGLAFLMAKAQERAVPSLPPPIQAPVNGVDQLYNKVREFCSQSGGGFVGVEGHRLGKRFLKECATAFYSLTHFELALFEKHVRVELKPPAVFRQFCGYSCYAKLGAGHKHLCGKKKPNTAAAGERQAKRQRQEAARAAQQAERGRGRRGRGRGRGRV